MLQMPDLSLLSKKRTTERKTTQKSHDFNYLINF